MPTQTSCPECKRNGYVHKALYDPTKYGSSAGYRGGHRAWCDASVPATSGHADSTPCRVCWGSGTL